MNHNLKNELGNVYGQLTVASYARTNVRGKAVWECVCSCGARVTVSGDSLRKGNTKSCGCLRKSGDYSRRHGHASTKHGVSDEYRAWAEMKKRCSDTGHISYKNYGGRGIRVCPEWDTSFETFLEDMGKKPIGTSLDRINTNADYSKSNCRWADRKTQMRNKRNNVLATIGSVTQTLAAWCEQLNIPYNRAYYRIVTKGLAPSSVLIAHTETVE